MKQTTPSHDRRHGRRDASLISLALLAVLFCHAGVRAQSAPTGPAGGDLSGTYPNPTLGTDRVRKTGDTMTGALNVTLPNPGTVVTPFSISSGGNALLNRGTAMLFHVPQSGASQLGGQVTSAWGSFAQTYMSFSAYNNGAFGEVFRADGRGFFGIGTANPTNRLHVASGTASATTLLFLDTGVAGGTAMTVGATANNESAFDLSVYRGGSYVSRLGVNNYGQVFLQPAGGDVAVGMATAPAHRLDVAGRVNASLGLCIAGVCKATWAEVGDGGGGAQWTPSASNIYFNTGNVGIGNTAPLYKLDITGTFNASGRVRTASDFLIVGGGGQQIWKDAAASKAVNISMGVPGTAATDDLYFSTYNGGAWAGRVVIQNSTGNVGVGTPSPAFKLDVAGQVRSSSGGFVFPDGTVQATASGGAITVSNAAGAAQFSAGSDGDALRFEGAGATSVSFDAAAKKVTINSPAAAASGWTDGGASVSLSNPSAGVGIGTANPGHSLEVAKAVTGNFNGLHVYNAAGSPYNASDSASLSLGRSSGQVMGQVTASNKQAGTFGDGYLALSTRRAEVVVERVRIDHEGRVGIGKADPAQALDVVGNIAATGDITAVGSISAKYQDVAEWVPSTQALAAGTVVVLDTGRSNHVLASVEAYDTRVAGVVSERPGIILGEGGAGKVMVATTGRVKVKVDATRTPIRIGDLLVTSGDEGMAMKSEAVEVGTRKMHAPGTIIGKALEPLEKGKGEILVLLSLQ